MKSYQDNSKKKGASTGTLCPFKTLKSFASKFGSDKQVKPPHNDQPKQEVMGRSDELERQKVFIDNLLRSSKDTAIIATDLNLKILYFSPFAEKLFGYSADAVIGKKVPEIHPHVREKGDFLKGVIAQLQTVGSHTFSMDLEHNGANKVIEATISPIKDDHGSQLSGLMLMARDVTKAMEQKKLLLGTLAELQAIFDNTILGLVLVRGTRIVRLNAIAEKMFGYQSSELTLQEWPDFQAKLYTDEEVECISGNGGRVISLRKKDGQLFWARERQVAITDDSEEDTVLYLFEDVSRQREMLRKIQQLSRAVEQSSNSIVITNTLGEIEYVNKAFVKVTGYSVEEALGLTPAILKSGKTPESVYKEMWLTLTAGREWSGDFFNKRKNGELYEEHVIISPLRDEKGTITHFVATKENISELKKARIQADSASQAKSTFLANMSHEIRTPMNTIIGMSELLLETELLLEQRRYLNHVNSSANHLLSIINDILDYSKIEAEQFSLEQLPFQPLALIDEVVAMLSLQARQKGLQLHSLVNSDETGEWFFLGDALRLQQVLLNLTSNAVKFTYKGTVSLDLRIRPSDADGSHAITFSVRDTGIGLSPEQQKDIFQRFTQSDSSITRRFGGTGLGLAISNRLVGLMGGSTIHVESRPAGGSLFSFTIFLEKCDAPHAAEGAITQSLQTDSQRQVILLVEDNPANQELAATLLRKMGHDVVIVNHGLEALHYLSKQSCDLVLMDVQMPVMDGLAATRCIRKFEQGISEGMEECAPIAEQLAGKLAGHHIHIVAVTANALDEDRRRCLDAGMDAYISKPYKKKSLQKITEKCGEIIMSDQSNEQIERERAAVSIEGVRNHLMNSYGLELTETEQIMDTYAESLQENLQNLRHAVKNLNVKEGTDLAHALKGAFLNLGLQEEADWASLLEKQLSRKILARHDKEVDHLISVLQPLTARVVDGAKELQP